MNNMNPVLLALAGTGGTFAMTALGAAVVFFFKKEMSPDVRRIFLGFASGVMIAASVWSLLIPAIEMAEEQGKIGWIPAGGGFILGGLFILLLDKLLPHMHVESNQPEGLSSTWKRTTLLVLAVTLHNIPEGLAVGLTFGLAAQGDSTVTLASAIVLAVGIGLQNFPEGAAISLPLRQEGLTRMRSFLYGAASGIVEPMAGVLGVILVGSIAGVMPWLLAMAAGAMIYVVVEELVPEACLGEHSHAGTGGVMVGFLIMMIMDVALG
ncbi:MAG TPA: ZIP family metal transporter, partial [Anaerovoracaceae bacterium]|nr:ZIP family metal transporter [Anaerovoracaceae bacterium]